MFVNVHHDVGFDVVNTYMHVCDVKLLIKGKKGKLEL